ARHVATADEASVSSSPIKLTSRLSRNSSLSSTRIPPRISHVHKLRGGSPKLSLRK
ncbi:hypothetical protein A2U01_0062357, partial [Trifolium medium]|nr:hypothetical protein [Trifolium medium]